MVQDLNLHWLLWCPFWTARVKINHTLFSLSIRISLTSYHTCTNIWTARWFDYLLMHLKTAGSVANSVDPDHMLYSVVFDLCLHYLLRPVCPYTEGKYNVMRNTRKGPLCNLRTMQVLISLHISAGWSEPVLSVSRISRYCRICWQTENAHILLLRCACWSEPTLSAKLHKGSFRGLGIIWYFRYKSNQDYNLYKKKSLPVFILTNENLKCSLALKWYDR